ncbi:hypothetical protein GA707_09650 [Nostocoides sp. F2B08]|uniref:hypothetical protein n=1 Tax=Nostocoides sp. F2B08 TaxID=2653936 RepID=UPI001263C6E4|nr:hypothetical protein [Tetrasphaera sp. F2B08]KAB7744827.1 hypothetical protein GA707_09650 [Tetrasphaera sp. F2B08]
MKLVIDITDTGNCVGATTEICIDNVTLGNNGTISDVVFDGDQCTTEGGSVTVYLLDVSNCTVNLLVFYSVGGVPAAAPVPLQSGNIPSGNTDAACQPPPPPA